MQESFRTQSPINQDEIKIQTERLFRFMSAGNSIHVEHPAKRILRIGYLNSRMAEIRKRLLQEGKDLFKRRIKVKNSENRWITVVEYSMFPF